MPLILGSELVLYTRCILEAKFNVADFEINKEGDAPGPYSRWVQARSR